MLTQLYIKNFALIDELDMDFRSGFSVITGETGAGKSIILGALGLVMGQRADVKSIKHGAEKCTVEAHFNVAPYGLEPFFESNELDYDANDCIIRREISASGKSRAFINDAPAPLTLVKELGERLIDIHSQHQNLLLNKEDFQLNVIDLIAQNSAQLAEYTEAYDRYKAAEKELRQLEELISGNKEREDYLRFQHAELEEAKLEDGQQEALEQESEMMSHAEDIKAALYQAVEGIDGESDSMLGNLHTYAGKLHDIEDIYPNVKELAERLDNCYIELKDIAQDLGSQVEDVDFDPQRLDEITQRLNIIYSLQKKYRLDSVAELIAMHNDIKQQLQHIDNGDADLDECRKKMEQLLAVCTAKAEKLTVIRQKSAQQIEQQLKAMLMELGIPKVQFQIVLSAKELSPNGCDKVSFLFSANTNTALQPVSQVASGGEIARVMLSLKAMISNAVKLPTIIFDEIDTGVSGRVAEKMANIMADMGKTDRQVIAITHLPQIAALGTTHYMVSKEETDQGTVSHMSLLEPSERIDEIAKMLSGSDVSAAAIDNAKTLLGIQ